MTNITNGRGPNGTQVQRSPGFNVPAKPEGRPLGAATTWFYPTESKWEPLTGPYTYDKRDIYNGSANFKEGYFNGEDARFVDQNSGEAFDVGRIQLPTVIVGVFSHQSPIGFRQLGIAESGRSFAGGMYQTDDSNFPEGTGHGIIRSAPSFEYVRTGETKTGTTLYYQVLYPNSTVELGFDFRGSATVTYTDRNASGVNHRFNLTEETGQSSADLYHGEFCIIQGVTTVPGVIETWFKDTYK